MLQIYPAIQGLIYLLAENNFKVASTGELGA